MSATPQRIALGADHGGFELKEHLRRWLAEQGHGVEDCGVFGSEKADYPVVAAEVARRVARGDVDRGIIIDGAGIGSSMVANKIPGVRAALCYDISSASNSREHNDANVLTLGARLIGAGLAEQIAEVWLRTACTEPRHLQRVAMIDALDGGSASCVACQPGAKSSDHGNYSLGIARFRADAARGLGQSVPSPQPGPRPQPAAPPVPARSSTMDLASLSPEDHARVLARVAELLASSGGACACCGPGCTGNCACRSPSTIRSLIELGAGRIGNRLGGGSVVKDVASYIDHTLLKPEATVGEIDQLCAEAREHSFASVCVNPYWVKRCAERLVGSVVKVCTVVGFPLGASVPEVKALEARRAIRDGAREIDMVLNIGALKGGDDEVVFRDIRGVVDACEDGRALCKVILETALLTDEEKVRASVAARRARADFVKTSTGFSRGGATAADVALMWRVVGDARMGVKASGGIRSYDDLRDMVDAGATRIGASAGIRIVKEAQV